MKKLSVVFMVGCVLVCLAIPGAVGAQDGKWLRYDDPSGLSFEYPAAWSVNPSDGALVITDPAQTSFMMISYFAAEAGLTAQACVENAATGLGDSFPNAAIQNSQQVSTEPDEFAANVYFDVPDGEGFASMVCRVSGGTALFFLAAVPVDQYDAAWPSMARIADSITVKQAAPAPSTFDQNLGYVTWTDPLENAFTVDVPKGWTIDGGMLDIGGNKRPVVNLASPDENVLVNMGVGEVLWFLQPTAELAQAGYGEGSVFYSQDHINIMVASYLTGGQAAQFLAEALIAPLCSAFKTTATRDLEDQSGYTADATGYVSAGEAAFTCTYQGQRVVGYYYVTTLATQDSQMGQMWTFDSVLGYLALEELANEAGAVLTRVSQTFALAPAWVTAQQQAVVQSGGSATGGFEFDPSMEYDADSIDILMEVNEMMHETSLVIIDNIDGYTDYEYVYDYDYDYGW